MLRINKLTISIIVSRFILLCILLLDMLRRPMFRFSSEFVGLFADVFPEFLHILTFD